MKKFIKNNKFLSFVVILYVALFIFMPDKAITSLDNSLYYIKEMLMIMPVILLLTALITAWIPTDSIEKNLGQTSGMKGSILAFLLGSFSAGPIYAAFPISKALLNKGASISNIVILLSTWAVVKVPMLLNEAKFLGTKFMIIRWILTTIAIFAMGYITSKLVKDSDLPKEEKKEMEENLYIDDDYCIGCGICANLAPDFFKMENKKAKVIKDNFSPEEKENLVKIANSCPPKVIKVKD